MRTNNIFNADGFFGISPSRGTVVSADYGVVVTTENDDQFIEALDEYIESVVDFGFDALSLIKTFYSEFEEDEFSRNIIRPIILSSEKRQRQIIIDNEKKRLKKEKQDMLKIKLKKEKERRKEENERIKNSL